MSEPRSTDEAWASGLSVIGAVCQGWAWSRSRSAITPADDPARRTPAGPLSASMAERRCMRRSSTPQAHTATVLLPRGGSLPQTAGKTLNHTQAIQPVLSSLMSQSDLLATSELECLQFCRRRSARACPTMAKRNPSPRIQNQSGAPHPVEVVAFGMQVPRLNRTPVSAEVGVAPIDPN